MPTPLPQAPRVFLSHASEDRERFVEPLGRRLREGRVDAWASFWEMQLGDRLAEKVFEEGLGQSDYVVIVLSAASIDKPWVRAEMETSTVLRIAEQVKVIAVVLEDTAVPVQLSSVIWHRVPIVNAASIDDTAAAITKAVYGVSDRPPLGEAPAYVAALTDAGGDALPGLTRIDTVVLREAARQSLNHENAAYSYPPLSFDEFAVSLSSLQLSQDDVLDAVQVLAAEGYLNAPPNMTRRTPTTLRLTSAGMEVVIDSVVEGYPAVRRRVAAAVVNEGLQSSLKIEDATGIPRSVIHHALQIWAEAGWLRLSRESTPQRFIYAVTPHLKRWLLS